MRRAAFVRRADELTKFVAQPADVAEIERHGANGLHRTLAELSVEVVEYRSRDHGRWSTGAAHGDEPVRDPVADRLRGRTDGRADV